MAVIRAPGYRWEEGSDSTVLLTFEIDPATSLTNINVEIEESCIKCWVEGEEPVVCGQLHQTVLPKKSGWRLQAGAEVSTVCVSLFKRVPISWSYPIKGDIDDTWQCDAQSHIYLAHFFASEGDAHAEWHHWQEAAAKRHPDALLALARVYQSGAPAFHIPRDANRSRQLLEQAAEQHQPQAMLMLGQLHQEGAFGETDNAAALEWYRKCLDQDVLQMFIRHTGQPNPDYTNIAHYNSAIILLDILQAVQRYASTKGAFGMGATDKLKKSTSRPPSTPTPLHDMRGGDTASEASGWSGVHMGDDGDGDGGDGDDGDALNTSRQASSHHHHHTRTSSSSTHDSAPPQSPRRNNRGRPKRDAPGSQGGVLGNATVSFGIAAAAVATFLIFHLRGGH
ncbi:hypothetical protein PTSG_07545 [Salpingoeca rosetta]|uniref:CS domain-containing protein n=1 Tax=Salpingoeca rosetta (strain ATCC 50818 / BSB-021) TaxID=946362 RepID=F2UH29_SALR5|nr:uncharacterized protein PTSG_07545 [Salpingoeca rosetta]EGD76428.1 hypothetical protein PTSG_07545 [Salpingoeca rosetta]|eukprot:XP_004991343.1 hypothetical protein PTSG_07545 [Salpingoeca rosetta]